LTKAEGEKIKVAGFNYNPSAGAFINDWAYLSGTFLFSEDGKKILIDNDDFKKTFKFFVDLYKVDKVCTPTFPDAMQSFMDGTTAMLWMHPFFNGVLKSQKPDLNFGVFAIPKFEGKARNWHYNNPDVSMGVNSKTSDDNKQLAFDLLNLFFADDKYMRDWNLAQGLAPTKISLENDETLLNDPVLKVIMGDFDNSVYVGPAPDQMTQDLIHNMIDPVLKGNEDIDSAVKTATAKVNQTLSDFNFEPAERKWTYANELK
ncbi:MAG: extracellular solute-binding protein, partial [Firmicutes bacterium]|nr:extracellular solute-binding protein [Bacillota bacterium]